MPQAVRTGNDVVRVAHDYIGEFLARADRSGFGAWGLLVTVTDGSAAYGEWPLSGRSTGEPSFQRTPLVRIRNRWHDSGSISALQNAVEILHEYVPCGGRGRHAA